MVLYAKRNLSVFFFSFSFPIHSIQNPIQSDAINMLCAPNHHAGWLAGWLGLAQTLELGYMELKSHKRVAQLQRQQQIYLTMRY